MNKPVMDLIGNMIAMVVGGGCVIWHKFLGANAAHYQKKFLSFIGIPADFSDQTIRAMQIAFLVAGLCFIGFGLVALFQIIKLR